MSDHNTRYPSMAQGVDSAQYASQQSTSQQSTAPSPGEQDEQDTTSDRLRARYPSMFDGADPANPETWDTEETRVPKAERDSRYPTMKAREDQAEEPQDHDQGEGGDIDALGATVTELLGKEVPAVERARVAAGLAKANLTEDQGRAVLELHKAEQAHQAVAYEKQVAAWTKESQSDPETRQLIQPAVELLQRYDQDGTVRQMLNETGYGNHPAIIKLLGRMATGG